MNIYGMIGAAIFVLALFQWLLLLGFGPGSLPQIRRRARRYFRRLFLFAFTLFTVAMFVTFEAFIVYALFNGPPDKRPIVQENFLFISAIILGASLFAGMLMADVMLGLGRQGWGLTNRLVPCETCGVKKGSTLSFCTQCDKLVCSGCSKGKCKTCGSQQLVPLRAT